MKAPQILFCARGQIAGALDRLDTLTARVTSLANVADDVATGVTPLDGLKANDARALSMALAVEVEQLHHLAAQIRSGYAHMIALASRLSRPPAAVDLTRGDEIVIEFEA